MPLTQGNTMAAEALTVDQAFELADRMHACGEAVRIWLKENWAKADKKERGALIATEQMLFDKAADIRFRAVGIVLNDADEAVKEIEVATKQASDAIGAIKAAKLVISISTAVLTLATAIVSGNPVAVAGGAAGLLLALESLNGNDGSKAKAKTKAKVKGKNG